MEVWKKSYEKEKTYKVPNNKKLIFSHNILSNE